MLPAGPLMIEHRLIEQTVALIGQEGQRIRSTGRADLMLLSSMTDFMRTYADRCHHGKEEEILFRALEGKAMAPEHRQMMERLVDDHRRSRALTGRLLELVGPLRRGQREAVEETVEILQSLAAVYPQHIALEDKTFFPAAMKYLSAEEREDMLEQFAEFDRSLIHEHYKAAVEAMRAHLGAEQ